MSRTLTLSSDWYTGLPEKRQRVWASKLADLCSPVEEVATLQGLLEETDSFTITVDAQKNPIAFRIGELACPAEEDPSTVGGRKRRSRIKKQTRRTQRKRRNTVRK